MKIELLCFDGCPSYEALLPRLRDLVVELLDEAVRRAYDDDADVDAALVPDMQGIGSGPDVMPCAPLRSASPAPRDIGRPLADTAGARHG